MRILAEGVEWDLVQLAQDALHLLLQFLQVTRHRGQLGRLAVLTKAGRRRVREKVQRAT